MLEVGDNLKIVTVDTTIYDVKNFTFTDSSINIEGKRNKNDQETDFNGELEFGEIAYMQSQEAKVFQTLVFATLTSAIIISGTLNSWGDEGITPTIKFQSGGSCPYVYSWNGDKYILEGEAFGTALGKGLETETCITLPKLKPFDNKLKIKLTNERPETHFFNTISLVAAEVDKDVTVYSDNKNILQTLVKSKKINGASDLNDNDLRTQLLNEDNLYWESDLSSANNDHDFEDQLFIDLKDVGDVDSISLVVAAINTEISSSVFKYLYMLLGDEFANFTRAAETDDELITILKETLTRSALKFDIWDGEKWKYTNQIYPEANFVKFNKLVRLPIMLHDGQMRIRLRCLTDVWKIDALHFDDSIPRKIKTHKAEILSFQSNTLGNIDDIKTKDDRYIKLLPGEEIVLEFNEIEPLENKKIVYSTNVGGYLYEWIIDESIVVGEGLEGLDTSTPKMKIVKSMMKNMDTFLPIIYEDWRISKHKIASNN